VKGGFRVYGRLIWASKAATCSWRLLPAQRDLQAPGPQARRPSTCIRSAIPSRTSGAWGLFEQTNGKKNSERSLFAKFYMIGSHGLGSGPPGPALTRDWAEGLSTGSKNRQAHRPRRPLRRQATSTAQRSNSSATARSIAPTIYAACACARRTRARASTSQGIYCLKGGKLTRIIDESRIERPRPVARRKKSLYANGSRDKYVRRLSRPADDTVDRKAHVHRQSRDPLPGITDGLRSTSTGTLGIGRQEGCGFI